MDCIFCKIFFLLNELLKINKILLHFRNDSKPNTHIDIFQLLYLVILTQRITLTNAPASSIDFIGHNFNINKSQNVTH